VIDPLKASCDPRLMLPTSLSAALLTAQVNQIRSASLDEIAEQLAAGDEPLTPDQRQRVVVLVRTTLDVFELEPGARERGTTAVLRTALARLTAFEPELTRMLVRHAAHLEQLEPILDALTADLELQLPSGVELPADQPSNSGPPRAYSDALRWLFDLACQPPATEPSDPPGLPEPPEPPEPRAVLAELRNVLEAPRVAVSLDLPRNLDTVRWLWIAAYLHGGPQRRAQPAARRKQRAACPRCGGTLVRVHETLTCPNCR